MSEEVRPRRLHPVVPVISLIRQLPEMAVPIIGVVAMARDEGFGVIVGVAGGVLLLLLAFQVLAWWRFTYTLLPHEMYIESGVFSRNRRSIPWDRVQDVEIERSPLARLFGLAKVKLETGSAQSDEGLLDSIALADAVALREEISARRGHMPLESQQTESAAPPVFAMSTRRILQAGALNVSLIWLAVIISAIQYFDRLLPWSIEDIEKWLGIDEQAVLGMISPVTVFLMALLFLMMNSIAGVIEMFVLNYGFTLSLKRRALHRVRGLLTRSEVAIPLRRIQGARLAAHLLHRRLGFCRVDVQTMGGSTAGGVQDLAPLANAEEARRLLAIAGAFVPIRPERFQAVASAHRWYDAQTVALPIAVVSLFAGFIVPWAWWGLAFAAVQAGVQVTAAPWHGWRIEDGVMHVRVGWFAQQHWMLPLAHIHSVSLKAGPVQRFMGLATVAIDSAGGLANGLRIRNLLAGEARALVAALRARRLAVSYSAISGTLLSQDEQDLPECESAS